MDEQLGQSLIAAGRSWNKSQVRALSAMYGHKVITPETLPPASQGVQRNIVWTDELAYRRFLVADSEDQQTYGHFDTKQEAEEYLTKMNLPALYIIDQGE